MTDDIPTQARAMAERLRQWEFPRLCEESAALLDRLATALETAEAGAAMFAVMAERRADVVDATDEEMAKLWLYPRSMKSWLRHHGLRLIRAEPSTQ